MGIAVAEGFGVGQAEFGEKRHRPRLGFGPGAEVVLQRGLGHLLHQLLGGVEGRCGRLRDIGHFLAAQQPQLLVGYPSGYHGR